MKNLSKIYLLTPVLVLITAGLLLIDALRGPGTVARHFLIDSRLFLALTLTLAAFFAPEKSKVLDFINKVNSIILIPLWLVYLFFVGIEAAHFPNYVLAAYKIHLDGLIYIPLFSLSLFIINRIKNELPKISISGFSGYIYLATIILVVYFMGWNLGETLNSAFNRDLYVLLHTGNSYDQKMYYQWGDFYNYMAFVKNNTSENATIIIPPELEPWLARTGDIQLVRAFLYPRRLVQYKDIGIPKDALNPGTFILVSWGDRDCYEPDCHGWPKEEIKTKQIFYKDPTSSNVIESKENFIYKKDDYKYVYGLIEI